MDERVLGRHGGHYIPVRLHHENQSLFRFASLEEGFAKLRPGSGRAWMLRSQRPLEHVYGLAVEPFPKFVVAGLAVRAPEV